MTSLLVGFEDALPLGPGIVGGKGAALARMVTAGIPVPPGVCLSTAAYDAYVSETGLRGRILYELSRKSFADMRWEELWDAALRVRNMFLSTPVPADMEAELGPALGAVFGDAAVVVRSSAPAEDTAATSFAGLHESYVNVRGTAEILKHVRLVWASLWSDAALLYRRELGLDVEHSSMAVVIQRIVVGEKSGVAFCRNPNNVAQAVIEAVHGLNQGMVDGTVEPDRWLIDRADANVIEHTPATREVAVRPVLQGTSLKPLDFALRERASLEIEEIGRVYGLAVRAETLFGVPQDVEWTIAGRDLFCLQSRAITTLTETESDDERAWYLSLRPGFERLEALREKIETQILPGMAADAEMLGATDPRTLDDGSLADEIERRKARYDHWVDVYWTDLIPFAHGVRFFGRFYNDAVAPEDPYEFVELLAGGEFESTRRNQLLLRMADLLRADPDLAHAVETGEADWSGELATLLDEYLERFGDVTRDTMDPSVGRRLIADLALRMAHRSDAPRAVEAGSSALETGFIERFDEADRAYARSVLELARVSYRMRDDDNIYLARVEAPLTAAVDEARHRFEPRLGTPSTEIPAEQLVLALRDRGFMPEAPPAREAAAEPTQRVAARQLVGQPAGPSIASGPARVVTETRHLFDFREGEILVCDAVEPDMTLVVPLAAGIVERRGGMLIHGAIIAREYGLPCVTGVPDVTELIVNGDHLTVDGHLGIVVIERRKSAAG